jgi:hypothetical protein
MAYRADGIGAEVVPAGHAGGVGQQRIDVELRPLRGIHGEALDAAVLCCSAGSERRSRTRPDLAMLVAPPLGRRGFLSHGLDHKRFRPLDGAPPREHRLMSISRPAAGESHPLPLLDVPWCWMERATPQRIRFRPQLARLGTQSAACPSLESG